VNGGEWIHALLEALERQVEKVPFEVVIADRCGGETALRISREHPHAQLLAAPPATTLPELRRQALEHSRGRYVLVTEDHTVPPPDWVSRLVESLEEAPPEVVAAGGPVDNAMRERAVDWAAFLCEYHGYLPPQPEGDGTDIAGMNVIYRRECLEGADVASLAGGFWESTIHPGLVADGMRFRCIPEVVIQHRKSFGFFEFLAQRFHYSRYFAGERFPRERRAVRWLFAFLSPLLPILVILRVLRGTLSRPAYRATLLRCLPALACFSLAFGLGELVGYLRGPGDSLVRIE
jgi:hypothetical protein